MGENLGKTILDKYTEQFGAPNCSQCGKPVTKEQGFHIALMVGDEEKDVPFTHWDCDKAYSGKIDAMLDEAHKGTEDGTLELGEERMEKKTYNDMTHFHIDDPKIAPTHSKREKE